MTIADQTRADASCIDVYLRYEKMKSATPHAAAVLFDQRRTDIARGRAIASGPPTPDALAAVDELARQHSEQRAADVLQFRRFQELKRSNPHAAAQLYNASTSAVERGRALDQEDEGGPEAA